ncbi:20770_t:CDS:2, partial [Racocetra persica]
HNSLEDGKGIRYYNYNFNSQIDKFELIDYRIENDKYVDTIIYPENKLDYVIEDLNNNEKYDSDASISSLSSNDSETTRCRKKKRLFV